MSKLKEDELLTYMEVWKDSHTREGIWEEEDERAHQQIVALIKKPKVTEEFIEKWSTCCGRSSVTIKQLLKEAGYQIGAKVTEEWIEEKAIELNNEILLANYKESYYNMSKDFIRSLVEEAK